MLPTRIETQRLLLRPLETVDLDDVLEYAGDPSWGRFLPVPKPYTRKDAEAFIALWTNREWGDNLCWAMVKDRKVVGGVDLRMGPTEASLGYSLARPLWGQGLAAEACAAVVAHAFQGRPQLDSINARADARNWASLRVMEKLGMQLVETLRANLPTGGDLAEDHRYRVTRATWEATHG